MTTAPYAETWTRTRLAQRDRVGDRVAPASAPVSIPRCSFAPMSVEVDTDRRLTQLIEGRLFMPFEADVLVDDEMTSPRGNRFKVIALSGFENPRHPMTGRPTARKFVRVRAVH